MEAMIDSGQEWMIPLLEYRDWLASTQNPDVKPEQREFKGRDGRIKITDTGKLRWRTYTLEFSKVMLRKLLTAQEEIQKESTDFSLISMEELHEIRRLWLTERQDWEDSLPIIYAESTGRQAIWRQSDITAPGKLEAEILQSLAAEHTVPLQLVQKLFDAEWQHFGMRRRATIHSAIERIFQEDWRSRTEIDEEVKRRQEKARTL